jgi:hypothetical protein
MNRLWDTWEIFDRTSSKEIKSMESYAQTMCIPASLSLL